MINWTALTLAIIIFLAINTVIYYSWIRFKKVKFREDLKARLEIAKDVQKTISKPFLDMTDNWKNKVMEKTESNINKIRLDEQSELDLIDIETKKQLEELNNGEYKRHDTTKSPRASKAAEVKKQA